VGFYKKTQGFATLCTILIYFASCGNNYVKESVYALNSGAKSLH